MLNIQLYIFPTTPTITWFKYVIMYPTVQTLSIGIQCYQVKGGLNGGHYKPNRACGSGHLFCKVIYFACIGFLEGPRHVCWLSYKVSRNCCILLDDQFETISNINSLILLFWVF